MIEFIALDGSAVQSVENSVGLIPPVGSMLRVFPDDWPETKIQKYTVDSVDYAIQNGWVNAFVYLKPVTTTPTDVQEEPTE